MKPNPKQWIRDNIEAFENYLKDVHYDEFPNLLDDDLPDHFNDWLANQSRTSLHAHAQSMCLDWAKWITDEYINSNFEPFEK